MKLVYVIVDSLIDEKSWCFICFYIPCCVWCLENVVFYIVVLLHVLKFRLKINYYNFMFVASFNKFSVVSYYARNLVHCSQLISLLLMLTKKETERMREIQAQRVEESERKRE